MSKIKDPGLFKSIKHFLTVYLPKIKSKSPHTVQTYRSSINVFAEFLKNTQNIRLHQLKSKDFNHENILNFVDWVQTVRNNSVSTRNLRLRCLRSFCKYLAGEDVLAYETYSQIQSISNAPTSERTLEKTLSIEQVKYLLELPDVSTNFGLRDRFYIALLYDTGCRNSEILNMKLGDFNLTGESASVKVLGKRKKLRITPVSKEVVAMFKQYASTFHSEKDFQKSLFFTMSKKGFSQMSPDNAARILLKYEEKAKLHEPQLPHLHPHLFRHARAMHLYQAGMPLPLVGEWLGHSQLETTLIYANADANMKKEAVQKIVKSPGNTVFTDEAFIFQDDETIIKKLYGLS